MGTGGKYIQKKFNLGAKVLSAKLATALNLLIMSMTTCLCNATEHVVEPGD